MVAQHVVVDGSNIATEGRTTPSLRQLDDAVRAFVEEYAGVRVTVVVDATFGHRIVASEKPAYEEGVLAGELVSPPAGAIGRGDAFVLQIADKAEASVLSNDSFQEFHGTYDWLFDEGRLIGGKPVPDVGWVFVLRSPVRGPASRRSTRSRPKKAGSESASVIELVPPPLPAEGPAKKKRGSKKATATATAKAGPEAAKAAKAAKAQAPSTSSSGGRRRRGSPSTSTVNEPVPFLAFVSAHPLGATVEGTVDRFSSHGAYVTVGDAHCYVPLKAMADPPPKSAREALTIGETRSFVVDAFDSPRRSIDLAIPGFAQVDEGLTPSFEQGGPTSSPAPAPDTEPAQEAPNMAVARKSTARKSAAKKSTAKRSPAKKAAKRSPAKKATARKSTAKKSTARKSGKKAAKKKATAKKSTAKKAAKKSSARKSPARKSTAKKSTTRRRSA
jgi:hypothetical protein